MASAIIASLFFLFLVFQRAPAQPPPPPQQPQENECQPRRCDGYEPEYYTNGPTVRFPFWLKGRHPAHCGYPDPAFALSCSPDNTSTFLELPSSSSSSSMKLFVKKIDYEYQVAVILTPLRSSMNCQVAPINGSGLLPLLQDLSAAAASSPFQLTFTPNSVFCPHSNIVTCPSPGNHVACPLSIGAYSRRSLSPADCYLRRHPRYDLSGLSLVSCPSSSTNKDFFECDAVDCLIAGGSGSSSSPANIQHIYAVYSDSMIHGALLSCTKLYTFPWSGLPHYYSIYYDSNYLWGFVPLSLSWYKPNCIDCESQQRKYCSMKKKINNSSSSNGSWENGTTIECFDKPDDPAPTPYANSYPSSKKTTGTKRLVVAGVVLGVFLLVGVVTAIGYRCMSNKLKKEDQVKIERFLEDYRALKPTRYTYAEIKRITDKFKDKLGQGGYGTVFKGKLSNDVQIAAKILNSFTGNGDDFTNEVGTMGRVHHVNVVRLVGYCADGYKKALVYEYLPNGSLDKVISSDQRKSSLGWEKLRDIALGIARGIEYLHQGCDQRILHFDIKPHNILLDKNFNPKVSDFGLAKLYSKEQSAVSVTAARGTVGYIAPEVFSRNFGNVSHKSDVYSFGMLLLEMVGGRKKNNNTDVGNSDEEVYFPEWIYKRLRREEESGGSGEIEEDGDAKIVKKLTVVGLWCIQWYPGDRPSMKVVVQMLEGDGGGETMAMPPNPFSTTNPSPAAARGTVGGRNFSSILEVISESE